MKKRIFVIDDEPDFTQLLRLSLEAQGYYHVGEENDALQAVAAARLFDPDLIVLDIMMPDVDGSEVAAQIRRDPVLRDIPILFLTALVSDGDAPQGMCNSGGQVFLPKSIEIERLMECIEEKLGNPVAVAG